MQLDPVPGFPRTLTEFEEQFADERACAAYLERLRWPDGLRERFDIDCLDCEVVLSRGDGETLP